MNGPRSTMTIVLTEYYKPFWGWVDRYHIVYKLLLKGQLKMYRSFEFSMTVVDRWKKQ